MSTRAVRFSVLLACVAACRVAAAEQIVQLPLFYNADVVREPGGTVTGGGIDPVLNQVVVVGQPLVRSGGRSLVSQAEAAANDAMDPHGLPDNGVLTVPGGSIQLAPYNGDNALRLGTFGADAGGFGYTADQLAGFDALDLYLTGAGAKFNTRLGALLAAKLDYAGENGIVLNSVDWESDESPERIVLNGMDRTGNDGAGFEDVDDVAIFRWRILLAGSSPLNSVSFQLNTGGLGSPDSQAVAILAAAGVRLPEPSALASLGIAGTLALRRRRR
jgi:hypothetical protein